jgi:predicted AlkP superfamily pyrophosphatase or phosphodiesterase
MKALALVLALAVGLAVGGCAPPASDSNGAEPTASGSGGEVGSKEATGLEPTVVLISLDGTRPVDVDPARLPSLVAIGETGLVAEALVPVDPSNTFPNHVSLATGVAPEVHRLVNNHFVDPDRGDFHKKHSERWIESEPIWSVAERAGIRAASYYWVGSEGDWTGGPGPSEWRRFSSRTSERAKVDQILAWLDEPDPARRPRLITCWFHGADHEGHESGPDSEAVTRALAPQDRQIARLVEAIEDRGLFDRLTLVIVSDHGMTTAEKRVNLADRLRRGGLRVRVLGIGGFASVVFREPDRTPELLARAVTIAREAGLEAHVREQAPPSWRVGDPRFGDVVVRAPIGTAIVAPTTLIEGFHGYDARRPEMAALLVARGRGVEPGTRIGRVSSLAVAPTVLRLLGLPIPEQMRAPPIRAMLRGLEGAAGAAAEPGRGAEASREAGTGAERSE